MLLMATLYDVGTNTINYHIKKIFEDSELQEDSVIRKFRITAADGKSYSTNLYSLEMIIAVGFKVNSERAVQFRKWVNQIAKDYTIKGWVMDDERLKRGTYLTEKYFDEQLERIREIRASERKFYQKITDLYATAIDYDKNSATTRRFCVSTKMYAKDITVDDLSVIIPTGWTRTIQTVSLTGKQIKDLHKEGYDAVGTGNNYPYVLVSPVELEDDKTYQVAISGISEKLASETEVTDSGIVGLDAAKEFFGQFKTLSEADAEWK